ncbi:tRNA pseudouridine(38-40) synthase TruA [Haloterrigena alkaliphila]|uniref:tRNA pseudouridine synthase A n=1 Tax=Haloterrigena alkaliphila TaxID=2816475 RepID=A0A8A2VDT8_9EURY|nr:tRNA pseudouridine(38-40) synthase TruA [Haloterrigena alkaliphila]QSX00244.1 tRNA pseudouridine(38-40) synthase TruA [Haloterrigena alkaliphila]
MPTRAFRIAYDGTGYHGFQRQPDVPTVEDALFDALRDLGVFAAEADKPDGYAAAGRTDAGVSALAQTVALEAPDWLTPRAFNAELPADIRAWAAADAPADFHATHDAERREYTYHLYAPTVDSSSRDSKSRASTTRETATENAVADDRFHAACEALSGSHDFHNLTPDDHNTERSPTLEATREGDFLVVTVTAGGFARELVRRLVSLAREVGTGDADLERIDRALGPEPLPGHEGIAPAPPEPLVLTAVAYPDLAFETDADAAASAREAFRARRIDRRTGARVAGDLADGIR